MNVEIIEPPHRRTSPAPQVSVMGAGVASATLLAALGIGTLALFGRSLFYAAMTTILWPVLFTPEFTSWVFGTSTLPFWKALIIVAVITTLFNTLRRQSWQRR